MALKLKEKNLINNLLKTSYFVALLPVISVFTISLSSVTWSSNANAAAKNYSNTWFEIEVILFNQLGDKSQLREAFPDSSIIPEPVNIIDLLGPYLTPDISHLKSRIANCPEFSPKHSAIQTTPYLDTQFTLQYQPFDKEMDQNIANNYQLFNDNKFDIENQLSRFLMVHNDLFESIEIVDELEDSTELKSKFELNSINTAYKNHSFEQVQHKNYIFGSYNIPSKFCIVPEAFFTEYKQQHPYFAYNGEAPKSVPSLLSGEEDLTTDRPYLINKTSLQLVDIVNDLKRSRNFKPLLHMGWRQITKTKNEAIPLKLYAGENLMRAYSQALTDYQQTLNNNNTSEEKQIDLADNVANYITEQDFINELDANNEQSFLGNQATINEKVKTVENQALEKKIALILKQAKTVKPTLETLLNDLRSDADNLVNPMSNLLMKGSEFNTNAPLTAPEIPPQAWTIEGYLKVEVDHFLHITADFNVINLSLAEQATQQLISQESIPLKSIRFEQNKRVRSTEIHYFDHPFMGMIVQIRRHKQIPVDDINTEGDTE